MINNVIEIYKIKGLAGYSCGGERPRFSPKGKAWRRMSDVLRHLSELLDVHVYDSCEIISLKYELKSSDKRSVRDLVAELDSKRKRDIEDRAVRYKARLDKEEMDEYKRLRAKYDGFLGDPD